MKQIGLFGILTIFLWNCSGEKPYEDIITKHFESEVKVVPVIEDIKVDTSASMESFHSYWTERVEELKIDLKKDYEKRYLEEKDRYEKRKSELEERKKLYRSLKIKIEDSGVDYAFNSMTEYKNKLDSAEKGLYKYSVIDLFEKLSVENSKLTQVTVKYKLNETGPTMIQKFIIEELQNDTTAYPTDETLIKFIHKSGMRR